MARASASLVPDILPHHQALREASRLYNGRASLFGAQKIFTARPSPCITPAPRAENMSPATWVLPLCRIPRQDQTAYCVSRDSQQREYEDVLPQASAGEQYYNSLPGLKKLQPE